MISSVKTTDGKMCRVRFIVLAAVRNNLERTIQLNGNTRISVSAFHKLTFVLPSGPTRWIVFFDHASFSLSTMGFFSLYRLIRFR